MNKRLLAIVLCCVMFVFCGCNTKTEKYKRISFNDESLDEASECIAADTTVTYTADETFEKQMPIYEISRRAIFEDEFKQMEEQLGITYWYWNEFDGYEIHSRVAPYSDPIRGPFCTLEMTDDELEELAWNTFNKIQFLEGEYEYIGKTATMTEWTMDEGEYVTEVTVSFYRTLDGVSVVGNDQCDLTFDASGLVEVYITLFDYQKIGTMDMVSLEEARAKIKTPDSLSINYVESVAKDLHVNRVQTFWVNQYYKGCAILQPIYTFYGTATFEDDTQTEFRSRIIAIPESYTYEEE